MEQIILCMKRDPESGEACLLKAGHTGRHTRHDAAPTPSPIDTTGHRHGSDKAICHCDYPNHPGVPEFVVSDPTPLPVEEKFMIYLDEEGDYLIQAQRQDESQYLTAHGSTPDDAVWNMRKILDLAHQLKPAPAFIDTTSPQMIPPELQPTSIATTQGDEVSLREELFKLLDGWHGLAHRPRHINQIMLVIQKRYPDAK